MDSFDERKNNAVKGLSFCKVLMDKLLNSAIEDLKCHAKVTIKGADNNNIEGERKNDKL